MRKQILTIRKPSVLYMLYMYGIQIGNILFYVCCVVSFAQCLLSKKLLIIEVHMEKKIFNSLCYDSLGRQQILHPYWRLPIIEFPLDRCGSVSYLSNFRESDFTTTLTDLFLFLTNSPGNRYFSLTLQKCKATFNHLFIQSHFLKSQAKLL